MSIQNVVPYLYFNGSADEAIRAYERALGARTEFLTRYGEAPPDAMGCQPADKQRVMHACLAVGPQRLMMSDTPSSRPEPAAPNMAVFLDFDDAEDMARKFGALAASGKVTLGLHDTFWGAKFGMLTDAFGINWLFNCMKKPE
jgi:PhnB protein